MHKEKCSALKSAFILDLMHVRPPIQYWLLRCNSAQGNFVSTKEWAASHRPCPNTRSFLQVRVHEEATERQGGTWTMRLEAEDAELHARGQLLHRTDPTRSRLALPPGRLLTRPCSVIHSLHADCAGFCLEIVWKQASYVTKARSKAMAYPILTCPFSCLTFFNFGRWWQHFVAKTLGPLADYVTGICT